MNACAHHTNPDTCTWCATARARQRMNTNRAAATERQAGVIRHRLQTVFPIAPDHCVVARRGFWGGFDVVEINRHGTAGHGHYRHRPNAEVVAAAVAATRTHHPEPRKATR